MKIKSNLNFYILFSKNFLSDLFFKTRLSFAIKLLSFKKSAGYLKNLKNILTGLKKDGYFKIEGFYSEEQTNTLNNIGSNILSNLDEINKTLPHDKKIHSVNFTKSVSLCLLNPA